MPRSITEAPRQAAQGKQRLRLNVWEIRGIRLETKLKAYQAVVLSTLLHGSETCMACRRHERELTTSISDASVIFSTSIGRTKSPTQRSWSRQTFWASLPSDARLSWDGLVMSLSYQMITLQRSYSMENFVRASAQSEGKENDSKTA